jgi:uncharacterized protein with FMN-binding domain
MTKAAAICGIGAAAAFLPSGMGAANAATSKVTTKTTVKTTTKKSGTFLGAAYQTQYGAVQVSVTVKSGKITKVAVPIYPNSQPRDVMINSQAIPMLEQEVMQAQSSNINNITGASFTAQGFYMSLVSALGKAGLK